MLYFATKKKKKMQKKRTICVMQCHLKPLTSLLFLYNSKAKGRRTKSSHQSSSKKHFLIMLLWPFRVTDTSLESCAEKQEHIWSYITSGSALFSISSNYQIECTWTNFPLPNTGNKRKPTLPHFLHAENKRRPPAPRTVFTERDKGVKGLSMLPNTY